MKQLPNIAVIDLETDPFKHGRIPKAFAAGWFDGKTYSHIWNENEKEVLKWCVERVKNFEGIVYAHNGGKFDFIGYLFKEAGETMWGEIIREIGGRLVKMQFGRAEIRDSYAILPAPLKSYDKGEIDYKLFERHKRSAHRGNILQYLRRDCESLHGFVTTFLNDHGTLPLTAASAGMKFLKKLGYKIDPLPQSLDEKFRHFYFGGLVLARKRGIHTGKFAVYDIKSAYPYAMLHPHPYGNNFEFLSSSKIVGTDFVCCEGIADGCFIRREKDKNTYGGVGRFMVSGWEFLRAEELGLFKGKILYVERPKKTCDYSAYVNHFYAQKEEAEKTGDKAKRQIAKIMLNAVYGKFAQRPDRYFDKAIMPADEAIPKGSEWAEECVFDELGFSIWKRPSKFGTFYNVATAASITGFVRSMLMKAIHETDPYYCDTDSIISDGNRTPSGIGKSLGNWSLETRGDLLYIAGKKLYALRVCRSICSTKDSAKSKGYYWDGKRAWKIASKGCRLTPDEMRRVCEGETIEYKNEAPTFTLNSKVSFITRRIKMTA